MMRTPVAKKHIFGRDVGVYINFKAAGKMRRIMVRIVSLYITGSDVSRVVCSVTQRAYQVLLGGLACFGNSFNAFCPFDTDDGGIRSGLLHAP
jgi:hypothetical protein